MKEPEKNTTPPEVIIIGAGLTGLTTAFWLRQAGIPFKVLEKNDRPGGVIRTVCSHGFQYECGPNSGIIGQPEVIELFDALRHSVQVEVANEAVKRRYILKNGRWEALPSSPLSAIRTPLFTLRDKFRILGEPFRRRGSNPEETLDQLVLRRMGRSFLDYAIDPFILGVYAGDPSKLVTQYAFPKLYALEQNYGSFIGGSVKKARQPKTPLEKRVTREVFSCEGGLQALTDALYKESGPENYLLGVSDLRVQPSERGFTLSGMLDGESFSLSAPKVISTVNGPDLNALLPFLPADHIRVLSSVQYAPTIEVVLGFNHWTGRKLDAFGGLIPHREGRDILGVLFLSACFAGRAPEGGALLTAFMGGVRNKRWMDAGDDEIRATIEKEVGELMEITPFKPDLFKIIRHYGAIPQYSHESAEKMKVLDEISQLYPGLTIGGNIQQGIGMADRIRQAKMLASQVTTS